MRTNKPNIHFDPVGYAVYQVEQCLEQLRIERQQNNINRLDYLCCTVFIKDDQNQRIMDEITILKGLLDALQLPPPNIDPRQPPTLPDLASYTHTLITAYTRHCRVRRSSLTLDILLIGLQNVRSIHASNPNIFFPILVPQVAMPIDACENTPLINVYALNAVSYTEE